VLTYTKFKNVALKLSLSLHFYQVYVSGPFHMSPVTGPGRILSSVHMGNFSPVDRDEIQEANQNGGT